MIPAGTIVDFWEIISNISPLENKFEWILKLDVWGLENALKCNKRLVITIFG